MSVHHIRQGWTTFSRERRIELAAQLPLPCIAGAECLEGGIVYPDPAPAPGFRPRTRWHVGHIIDAAKGGRPTRANTGPIHARCNLRAGGTAGARVTNRRRSADRGIRPW